MTPAEQVAAERLWEAIDDAGIKGRLYREDCDWVVAEVVKALGLREESDRLDFGRRGVRNRVRLVTDWREVEP